MYILGNKCLVPFTVVWGYNTPEETRSIALIDPLLVSSIASDGADHSLMYIHGNEAPWRVEGHYSQIARELGFRKVGA